MTNLIILLIVWCSGIVLVYAWMLARSLRRAFREEITVEPAEDHLASAPAEGHILSYAKPPAKPRLTRRWPIVSALMYLGLLPLMAVPLFPLIAMSSSGIVPQAGAACAIALGLTLLVLISVAYLGLQDVNGRPAAANWCHRGLVVLCWLAVLLLTWAGLEWRAQRILDAALVRADALGQQIQASSHDGSAAAAVYRQAGVGLAKGIEYYDEWQLVAADGRMAAPPPPPEAQVPRIALLRQAAAMDASGLTPAASEYWFEVGLPHLPGMRMAATLLHRHAISEARAGRIDSAIADINAIRGMADHCQQGLGIVEMLSGAGIHGVADDALQHILPMVKDPAPLDQIRLGDPARYMPVAQRCMQGEIGIMDRRLLVQMLRGQVSSKWLPAYVNNAVLMAGYRVVLGENDVDALEEFANQLPAMVPDDPAAMAKAAATLTGREMAMRYKGLIVRLLMPGFGRTADWQVEAAGKCDLSRAAVAATRFRLQQGRLPSSFEELVAAGLLPAVPVDPFDGKPMRFAVHKDCVFIYTIGRNRTDNGGCPYMLRRGVDITESNPGFILSDRPLWELDLVPPGFVPATQESEPQ